ncbi:MAG: FAD-binding oxidoreductase, partial [Planctomycetota bacterium]
RCVVRPDSPEAVARVLALASEHGARVQPIGANTGLVGASNPDASGEMVVLSLERLSKQIEVDVVDRVAVVDGGVTLSALQAALEPHGLWLPIDLGADPQVGGMVATNTGGTRLVRYGDVRRHVLGLEVALPDGRLVSRLRRLRKDNTGLDWKQLFIGTSGSLGIVTRVALEVVPRPVQSTAVLACAATGDGVLSLLTSLERAAGEVLSAFEVLSREAIEPVLEHGTVDRDPFPGGAPAYAVLVELSSSLPTSALDLETLLGELLEAHVEADPESLEDVLVGQAADFWHLRHQVSESLAHAGRVLALDLSVPRSRLAEFSSLVRTRIAERAPFVRVCDFGHWGDGGTHFNLVWNEAQVSGDPDAFARELQAAVYDWCVAEFEGSYSAEHGVGPHNRAAYERYTDSAVRSVAGALERHFDPEGRLGRFQFGPI